MSATQSACRLRILRGTLQAIGVQGSSDNSSSPHLSSNDSEHTAEEPPT